MSLTVQSFYRHCKANADYSAKIVLTFWQNYTFIQPWCECLRIFRYLRIIKIL